MTRPSPVRVATTYIKEYAAAVIAAGLMYGGIHQIVSVFSQSIGIGVLRLINAAIGKAFRDITPLPDYAGIAWSFYTRVAAIGVIVVVAGFLVGLWANSRSQRESAGAPFEEIQN